MARLELVGMRVERLRGFATCELNLDRELVLIVGPNNAGKTSLLRILDWAINGVDEALLVGDRVLTGEECRLLLPASTAAKRARRLILRIRINDGRRYRAFQRSGLVELRLQLNGAKVFASLREPGRGEAKTTHDAARRLWRELRESHHVVHIPAARDAASTRFRDRLLDVVLTKLSEQAIHDSRGGAPQAYRTVKSATDELSRLANDLLGPVWDTLSPSLPAGLAESGRFRVELDARRTVDVLAGESVFTLTTGDHDDQSVPPVEVGAGLQSLLDFALVEARLSDDKTSLTLFEEPEAFLHPAAQRQIAELLASSQATKRVVTTHSPVVVSEGQFRDIRLLRNHRCFAPRQVEERRAAINSDLLTGDGAEAIFADGVLLVEGAGDVAFFEALRRRLAAKDASGALHRLRVVGVGGKQRFAPWIQLFEGFSSDSGRPIEWLVLADSGDAASDIRRAMRDARLTVPQPLLDEVANLTAQDATTPLQNRTAACDRFNEVALEQGVPLHLLAVDLEYSMLSAVTDDRAARLAEEVGADVSGREELTGWLGSRAYSERAENKGVWMRARIGNRLALRELSPSVRLALTRWLGSVVEAGRASELVEGLA